MRPSAKFTWRLALVALLTSTAVILAGGEPQAQSTARPYQVSPDATLPSLGPERLRVVPPPTRVRITEEARDGDDERRLELRNRVREAQHLPDEIRRRDDGFEEPPPRPSDERAEDRARTRARHDDGERRERRRGRRTADARTPPTAEVPSGYGRLIVITGFDNVQVTIDGQPYPYGSMEGVLLWANELYEVALEGVEEDGSSSSSGGSSRVIDIRVGAGETRVLMANLGGEQSGRVSSRPTRERTRRSSRSDDDDDDDEEIGYLGVSSSPRGIVYVDGENTGQMTPARRIELDPGRHEVRIFYESEDEFSETKNVLIREGVNTNVFFRMRRDELEDDED